MSTFPILKTGAVTQYPLECTLRSVTQSVQFLDGSRQQYRLTRTLRRWKISLAEIDEQEVNSVVDFVEQQEGSVFPFTDPVTGDEIPKCIISSGGMKVTAFDELRNSAVLVIEEVA